MCNVAISSALGKRPFPKNNSATKHPKDHMSMGNEYCMRRITSGARYRVDCTGYFKGSLGYLADPKSINFT